MENSEFISSVLANPDFHGLPLEEQRKVVLQLKPEFSGLPLEEQTKALDMISQKFKAGAFSATEPAIETPPPVAPTYDPAAIMSGSEPDFQTARPKLKDLSPYYRPALEGAGMLGGAAIGTAAGLPAGPGAIATGLATQAGGYALGKRAADQLDEWAGIRKPLKLEDVPLQTASDLAMGGAYAMGGPVVDKVIFQPVLKAGKWVFDSGKRVLGSVFTKAGTEQAAGTVIRANTSVGDIYAANMEEAAAIEKAIPGLKFSMGQRSNDPNLIKLERTQMRKPGSGANLNAEQIAANDEALRNYYQQNLGGKEGIDDLLGALTRKQAGLETSAQAAESAVAATSGRLPAEPPQQVGQGIIGKIKEAKAPVKAAMNELEAQIPDYPMEFKNTEKAIGEALSSPKSSVEQLEALGRFQKDMVAKVGGNQGTHAAMGLRRTLNDQISAASLAGRDSEVRALMQVKNALESDLSVVSEKAVSGGIKTYRGQAGDPSKLADILESNLKQIAELKAKQAPDIKAMQDVLAKANIPSMRVTQESEAAFAERLGKDYTKITGKPAPTKLAEAEAKLSELINRNDQIKDMLAEMEPGADVGAAMRAFNTYAREQYFERFKTGATNVVTAKGNQITGARMPLEKVGNQFATPSGADDLIRAIGPQEAATAMRGHFSYDMMRNTTDPATGKIVTNKLNNWMQKNGPALEKFGIKADFDGVVNAQAVADKALAASAEFEKTAAARMLKADPGKAIAAALGGNNSAQKTAELMQMVKNDPAALRGLRTAYTDHMVSQMETTAKDIAGNPTVSKAAVEKLMKKNAETLEVLFRGEPEKIQALKTMQKAYEIIGRNKTSPIGGGSDTAENLMTEIGKMGGSVPLPRSMSMARACFKVLSNIAKNNVDEVVTQGLFNPEYADKLISAARGKIPPEEFATWLNGKVISLEEYRQAKAAGIAAVVTGADPLGLRKNRK